MISLTNDTVNREDINQLISWLQQEPMPKLTKGEVTKQYEQKFANYIGAKYGVMVNSGSSAILLTLYALMRGGYLRNKNIAVPAVSWVTDVSSPMQLGLNPIIIDCNLTDYSVDIESLEATFKKYDVSALIVVSVLGFVPDYDKLLQLCQRYEVVLIEDVCESLGSSFRGVKLGSIGLASCFSTYFSHHISTIEGGMVCTSDDKFYELLVMLRSHGWTRDLSDESKTKYKKTWNINDFENLYTFYEPGFNLRSTDLQAFIGLGQLDKLPSLVEKRNINYQIYRDLIKNNLLSVNHKEIDFVSNFAYPVALFEREEIVNKLVANGVEVRPFIAGSMGAQPFWTKYGGETYLKNADFLHRYGFYLPNHHGITEDDIKFIANLINNL